jgi:hypothetical protein
MAMTAGTKWFCATSGALWLRSLGNNCMAVGYFCGSKVSLHHLNFAGNFLRIQSQNLWCMRQKKMGRHIGNLPGVWHQLW